MRKFLKVFGALAVGVGLLAAPSIASAQEVSVRVEPGVAVPLTDPQDQRFGVGWYASVRPELTLAHYLGVGPAVSYTWLPSRIDGIDNGTSLGFGAFARLKRPHDYAHNSGTGLSAVSPWVEGDAGYARTQPLDRFMWSAAVGAAVPTSDSRVLWVGPFARFQDIHEAYDKAAVDTRNSKTLILGLSFELGAAQHRPQPAAPPPPAPPPVQPTPAPVPPPVLPPKMVTETDNLEIKQVIQFAWDSPVLDTTANAQLAEVVKKLASAKEFKSIRIEGHASSEGQVKHNDVLSQNRANSVLEFLVAHGIPREKLSAVGHGSRVPVASNKTEAGRVQNRRAEFTVRFVIVREVPAKN